MRKYFYPFITDNGIFLNEENIGFTTAEIVEHKKKLQDYGIKSAEKYLTMKTKGLSYCCLFCSSIRFWISAFTPSFHGASCSSLSSDMFSFGFSNRNVR